MTAFNDYIQVRCMDHDKSDYFEACQVQGENPSDLIRAFMDDYTNATKERLCVDRSQD